MNRTSDMSNSTGNTPMQRQWKFILQKHQLAPGHDNDFSVACNFMFIGRTKMVSL